MAGQTDRSEWARRAIGKYEGPLLRYASKITADLERARDVVQDVFISLLTTSSPPADGYLAEWLFTVCRNRAIDVRKKESRMNQLNDLQAGTCVSVERAPHASAEIRESADRAMAMLETLGESQQEAIRLRFQNGFTYAQIANITGMSVSNVGFLIHTAIKTLRQKLTASGGPAEAVKQEHRR
ncbi:MAG: sigma-70 family RNA polymerase sigma factor [Planctomycetes bacterium]|nr:sigma-70 family RNA polymerase sigma factor [Planctomycetota bacterium]